MTCNPKKMSLAPLAALALVVGSVNLMAQAGQSGDQSQTDPRAAKKPANQKTDATATKDAATSSSSSSTSSASSPDITASHASAPKLTASGPSIKRQSAPANSAGMVWVNTDSGVYHNPGTRWY
jgi:hypothetical protein